MLPLGKMTKIGDARVLDVYMYSSGHMGLEKNMGHGHGPNIDMLLNTPPQTQGGGGGSEALSLSVCNRCCSRVCALVNKSPTCSSDGTY